MTSPFTTEQRAALCQLIDVWADKKLVLIGAAALGAAPQLKQHAIPRILVFGNHDGLVDVLDLEEAVQGFQLYGESEMGYLVNTWARRIAEGRIREERWLADLYIWIEPPKRPRLVFPAGRAPYREEATGDTIWFRVTSERGMETATRFFGCKAELAERRILSQRDSGIGYGPPQ